MPNVTVDSSILWFAWIYMMIFQWGLSKAIQTFGRTKVTFACECPLLPRLFVPASALVLLGQLSEKKNGIEASFFLTTQFRCKGLILFQVRRSWQATELFCLVAERRRKTCSWLEVVVLWSATIIEYQDISRYIKIYQDIYQDISRCWKNPEAAWAGTLCVPHIQKHPLDLDL